MSSSRPARPGTYRPSRPVQGAGPGQRPRGDATRDCMHCCVRVRSGGRRARTLFLSSFLVNSTWYLALAHCSSSSSLFKPYAPSMPKPTVSQGPADARMQERGRAVRARPHTTIRATHCGHPSHPAAAPAPQPTHRSQIPAPTVPPRSLVSAPKPASPLTRLRPPSSRARELSRSFLIWSMTILKPRPMPKPTTVKPTDMRTQLEAAVAPSQPRHKL